MKYDDLLDIQKLEEVYHIIKLNTLHKDKIVKFEIFLTSNFVNIIEILRSKKYMHSKYNIFLITEPKPRIIMSESMTDKLINHLVSKYVLFKVIEPKLIDMNIATRGEKGTKLGIYYIKKYINSLKVNNDKIYALKCDIHKFFYSIDHSILIDKLRKVIIDKDIMNLLIHIINSTDYDYINEEIERQINRQKYRLNKTVISKKERDKLFWQLDKIPMYEKHKGLPIGNMSSQIMAIFYLNDLDHFIKEKLRCKHYIRYMDDLILFSPDKEYLKKCLGEIENFVSSLNLRLNNKTQIYEIHKGVTFLGYKFILKEKKLYTLITNKTKRKIKKKWSTLLDGKEILPKISTYNGYLVNADSKGFVYKNYTKAVREHNEKVYEERKNTRTIEEEL